VYELMRITPRVRSVLLGRGGDDVLRRAAQATGLVTMFQDGLRKVEKGHTTFEELQRVVPPDELDDTDGPEAALPPSAVPAPLSADVRISRPTRILVVDDDQALREILKDILVAERYEVVDAADGEDALAKVHQERPDLIVTDLQMPNLDGLELLRKLRRDLSTCQIPVVFLTVIESLDSEVQAMDMGADDYISKPVEKGRLLSRIRRSLFRAHLMRAVH